MSAEWVCEMSRFPMLITSPETVQRELKWLPVYSAWYRLEISAAWFISHYRERAKKNGIQAVAKQLRKQGVPVDVAVSILATR
jgi:hypothetical protein